MTWVQTYKGNKFDILRPEDAIFDIEEIAHSLSNKCRFGGHCIRYYSVAEHCVLVSRASEHPKWGLLHDVGEAFALPDWPTPFKKSGLLDQLLEVDQRLIRKAGRVFNVEAPAIPAEVKLIDSRILADEVSQNMNKAKRPEDFWEPDALPLGIQLQYLQPDLAEKAFIDRANEIGLRCNEKN